MSRAAAMSGGNSGSIEMQPETWNPPIATCTPAARNWRGEVDGARELVRLHPDQADEPAIGRLDAADDALDRDDGVALVIGVDLDVRHPDPSARRAAASCAIA